jgi:hypothetical protein
MVRTRPGKRLTKLANMAIDRGDSPITNVETMSITEKELFFKVITSCIQAMHQTHPIQQAKNMEAFFASTCRTSIFYAGLYVREYRKMLREDFELD